MSQKTELLSEEEGQNNKDSIEIPSVSLTIPCPKCQIHCSPQDKLCNHCGNQLKSNMVNDVAEIASPSISVSYIHNNNVIAPAAKQDEMNNNLQQPLINNNDNMNVVDNSMVQHIDEGVAIQINDDNKDDNQATIDNIEGVAAQICRMPNCNNTAMYQCCICQSKTCTIHTRIISQHEQATLYGCYYCVQQQLPLRVGRRNINRNVARCCIRRLIIRLLIFFILIIIAGIYASNNHDL